MASLLSRNFVGASRFMTRSFTTGFSSIQRTQGSNLSQYRSLISSPSSQLTFTRSFSETPKIGQEHLKDGLPEQYKWTADHLETYLRNFASKHNIKQEDLDHMIKTFVKGPTSAAEFFKLDRESLADKIGKASPERTRIGNLLVADLWKETQAVGRTMQNYGAILVAAAAVIFGAYVYNSMSGDKKESAKDKVKSAAHDAKESVKAGAHDAKESVKAGAHDLKDKAKSAAHDAKESIKSSASDAKHEVKSAARDVKETAKNDKEDAKKKTAQAFKDDGAVGKQFTEKGAIGGAAQKIGGPFDKEGAIGKQFTKDGAIGGRVQDKAEQKEEEHSKSRR